MQPSVSSGPSGVSFCRITGPSSSPSVGRKIERPVLASPRMIGQLIELGPRYFGKSDGWYWIVPFFGILTNSCGANCSTKAMMPMSALSVRIASSASLSRSDGNWKILRPLSCAAALSGSAFAPSFSGAQNTPATSSPRARNASSTALPKSCCPTIAIFITLRRLLWRYRERPHPPQAGDFGFVVAEDFLENLVGVLAKQRRTLDARGRIGELDRHPDVVPLAALRMVELHPHVTPPHVLVVRQVLGAHDGTAGHVQRVQDRHVFALGVVRGELRDQRPHLVLVLAAIGDLREAGIGRKARHPQIGPDAAGEPLPHRLLHHDVQPIVGPVRLAVDGVAELAAARVVAGARHGAHSLLRRHGIFRKRLASQPLVVAELDAAKVHYPVHHRNLDVLPFSGAIALVQGSEQSDG